MIKVSINYPRRGIIRRSDWRTRISVTLSLLSGPIEVSILYNTCHPRHHQHIRTRGSSRDSILSRSYRCLHNTALTRPPSPSIPLCLAPCLLLVPGAIHMIRPHDTNITIPISLMTMLRHHCPLTEHRRVHRIARRAIPPIRKR